MKKLLILMALLAGTAHAACTGSSPTWTSTLDSSSLQTCINNASNGDTINVSGTSATWSADVNVVSKQVTIICTGSCNVTGHAFFLESINALCSPGSCTTPSVRISGFHWIALGGHIITIQDVRGFRIDHNSFVNTSSQNCINSYGNGNGRNWGVIDHNAFTYCQLETLGGDFGNSGNSDNQNWADADPTGTQNVVDYEDDTFDDPDATSGGYFNCFDAYMGGFYVVRMSTLSGCRFEAHGLQGDNSRGSRGAEIYDNTINGIGSAGGGAPKYGYSPFFQRGGTHKIHHNTLDTTWLHLEYRLDTDRAEEDSIASQVNGWQFIDGLTKSSYLTTPGNLGGGYTTYPSNKTIMVDGAGTGGYPGRDQLGAGMDASTWASGWATTPPSQAHTPVYIWKNPMGGTEESVAHGCETPGDNLCINYQANIQLANRDWYAYNASFTGTSGVGEGVLASRPATCTTGVGYWVTDQGNWNTTLSPNTSGRLDICTSTNTWTAGAYTPLTYPNLLIGGGGTPAVSLSSLTLSFGRQLVTTTSSGQAITLTNSGGATLNISSIALTTGTQYAITANTCSSTLGASLTCTVTVKFTPLTLGSKSDSLVFTTDAASSPDSVSISGGGIPSTQVYDWSVPTSNQLCTNSNTGTGITTPAFIASHAYSSVRYWVQPTTPNGHFYKVTSTGTTSTEPSWNTGSGSTTTSGSVTFTEQGATNAGECLDEYFLYVLPNIDGAALGFNAFDLDPSNGGCTAQAGGGYTFTSMDTTINTFVGAGEWGVQDGVVLVYRPGTYSSPNSWTPCYWMSSTYAATLGAAANHACYCSGYPGDKTAGTNACFNDGDVTGVPVPFDVPFQTAYNAMLAALVGHVKAATYHSSVAYARHGASIGGENFPFCVSAMKVQYSYSTAQIKTAWNGEVQSIADQLKAATPNYSIVGAMNGLTVPGTPGVVGYDWADAQALIYSGDGFGIGDQGLTQADINAFATNGYASGGSASLAGTYCSNDFCYNFHAIPGALPAELQMGTVSNPTGAGTGSLVNILPFATQQHASSVEIYNQDLMIAFNPNYPQYGTYHVAYALAISNVRNGIAGPTSVPNGIYGTGIVSGSSVIQ